MAIFLPWEKLTHRVREKGTTGAGMRRCQVVEVIFLPWEKLRFPTMVGNLKLSAFEGSAAAVRVESVQN
jgi:hypothetical protein